MITTIRFEDTFTVEILLRDINKGNLKIDKLKQYILDAFIKAYSCYRILDSERFSNCEMEILVLMRSPASNKKALAYFDLNKIQPDSKNFSFKVYFDTLTPLIEHNNYTELTNIFVHEIAQMIDYSELLRNYYLAKNKINNEANLTSFATVRSDMHIILFNLLMHFRAEGIATLLEYIINGKKPNIINAEDAAVEFDKIITALLNILYSVDMNNRTLPDFVKRVYPLAYTLGAGVLIYGLMQKHQEENDFIHINNCILEHQACKLINYQKLIEKIIGFSSFDFLRFCLVQDWLLNEVKKLTIMYSNNLNIDIFESFYKVLHRIKENKDKDGFVGLLKNLTGGSMAFEEILSHHKLLIHNKYIPDEIKTLSTELCNQLEKKQENEVILYALTYTFESFDVLDDTIDYFGYIDDMEILTMAKDFS